MYDPDRINQYIVNYNPDFHIPDLLARKKRGEHDFEIAAAWHLSYAMYKKWIKIHSDFKEAYDTAKTQAAAYLIKEARENLVTDRHSKFNEKAWAQMMKLEGIDTEQTMIEVDLTEKTFQQCKRYVREKLKNQEISVAQAKQIIELIMLEYKASIDVDISDKFEELSKKVTGK